MKKDKQEKKKQKRKTSNFRELFYLMTGKYELGLMGGSWNQLSGLGPVFKINDCTNLPKLKYSRLE